MKRSLIAAALVSLGLVAIGCGGPNYRFDPLPSPAWITQNIQVDGALIKAVGLVQATPQVMTDSDLAKRNALQQVAASIQAQVVGRSQTWSAQMESGGTFEEREMTSSNVEVRTRLRVEAAEVDEEYRDEATKTHYTLLTVDKSTWVQKIGSRLNTTLNRLERLLTKAQRDLDAGRVFKVTKALAQATEIGNKSSSDLTVVEVLVGATELVERANILREQVEAIGQAMRDQVGVSVSVSGGSKTARDETRSKVVAFLKERGFQVTPKAAKLVSVKMEIGHGDSRRQQVGSRTDYLVSARGSLRVMGADGREVTEFSFDLRGDRYQERNPDASAAAAAAEVLAGHTLASQFRSRFRKMSR